jgi:hypothetical protein
VEPPRYGHRQLARGSKKPAKFVVQILKEQTCKADASQLNRLGLLNFQRLDDPVSPTAPRAFSRAAKPLYRIDAETLRTRLLLFCSGSSQRTGVSEFVSHAPSKFYGQAERAISTGELHALLRFNLQPINQVVYLGPSLPLGLGDLILRSVSRLYAFSVYRNRTSLTSRAIGMTAGIQEVRPSRSSRTKDRPSQISCAHNR